MLYLSQSRTKDLTYQVNGASKPATDQRSSLLDSLGGILLNFFVWLFNCLFMKENETAQAEIAQVKSIRVGVMSLIGTCDNRAKLSQFALSKSEFGSSILQTIDVAMADIALTRTAKTIVDCLADNEDEKRSIHKLTRPEHADENYLAFLLAKLGNATSQNSDPSLYNIVRAAASLGASMTMPAKLLVSISEDSAPADSSLPEYLELKSALMTMVV
jgi:hypothetical protein